MISISNSGKTISVILSDDVHSNLVKSLGTDRFAIKYNDGLIEFHPGIEREGGHIFSKARHVKGRKYNTYLSSKHPEMPVFGITRWESFLIKDGVAQVPLPPRLSPPLNRVTRSLVLTKKYKPNGNDNKAPYGGRWKSAEARDRSLAALAAGRAKYQKERAKVSGTFSKRFGSETQLPLQPETVQINKDSAANLIVGFGGRTLVFQVPEDKLLDYVVELSEGGYRVKA